MEVLSLTQGMFEGLKTNFGNTNALVWFDETFTIIFN
jgi:hypothetical protein